jgi:D-alanyl-D-alanine carboxypeptidase
MRRTFVLICLFLMTRGVALPAAAQDLPDTSSVLDYIADHPDDVAVLCYTPGKAAEIDHLADEPFPLASVYKLVILAELARQADAGLIDPTEDVPLADVNAYWLPGTDGNAHQMFLDTLPKGQETVTLQALANGMIHFSSNAAPDYLLSRLGKDGFPELFEWLGLGQTDVPAGTYLGLYLAEANHETGLADPKTVTAETVAEERTRLENLFLTDADWREAELTYLQQRAAEVQQAVDAQDYETLGAEYQRQVDFLSTYGSKASARDMLRILEAAYEADAFSDAGRAVMQDALDWLFEVNPANREVYDALATKGGSMAGVMTGAWYADPKSADPVALAVFYRNVPPEVWGSWSSSYLQQALELRVIAYGEGCGIFADALG